MYLTCRLTNLAAKHQQSPEMVRAGSFLPRVGVVGPGQIAPVKTKLFLTELRLLLSCVLPGLGLLPPGRGMGQGYP